MKFSTFIRELSCQVYGEPLASLRMTLLNPKRNRTKTPLRNVWSALAALMLTPQEIHEIVRHLSTEVYVWHGGSEIPDDLAKEMIATAAGRIDAYETKRVQPGLEDSVFQGPDDDEGSMGDGALADEEGKEREDSS